jgi:hypothetical protein
MGKVSATLELYVDAGKRTAVALTQSWLAAVVLLVWSLVLGILSVFLGSFGMAGGMLVGLAQAAAAGTYLFLLEAPVLHRRAVVAADVREGFGAHMWTVVSVAFLYWVASLLVSTVFGVVGALLFALAAFIAVNPAPELVYQGSSRSIALVQEAARFVFDNWIEWFLPQLVLFALLFLLVPLVGPNVLFAFGPSFGFTGMASQASAGLLTGTPDLASLLRGVLAIGVVHLAMLFRGFLYQGLNRGSPRMREWKSRFS